MLTALQRIRIYQNM
uniref:Uncharacterized protein n=1 Tax=Arundo donax TaxID=35708 RepID=A0A0A9HFQ5_ARUDO